MTRDPLDRIAEKYARRGVIPPVLRLGSGQDQATDARHKQEYDHEVAVLILIIRAALAELEPLMGQSGMDTIELLIACGKKCDARHLVAEGEVLLASIRALAKKEQGDEDGKK